MKRLFDWTASHGLFTIVLLSLTSVALGIHVRSSFIRDAHYVQLAQAFLRGYVSLPGCVSLGDIVFLHNKYFLTWPPLPSILLLPFVAIFGISIDQYVLVAVAAAVTGVLLYKIAKKLHVSSIVACWTVLYILFGTTYGYLMAVGFSSYLQLVVGMMFLVFALHEFFTKQRWMRIGIWLSCAILTRQPLFFASSFFFLEIISHHVDWRTKFKHLFRFTTPILLAVGLSLAYNYARFGSLFESGHGHVIFGCNPNNIENMPHGLFSLFYIPTNLYHLFMRGFEIVTTPGFDRILTYPYLNADIFGQGILVVSPLVMFTVFADLSRPMIRNIWIAIVLTLGPALLAYTTGGAQYGYRYLADVLPFIFLLLLDVFRKYKRMPLGILVLMFYSFILFMFYSPRVWIH